MTGFCRITENNIQTGKIRMGEPTYMLTSHHIQRIYKSSMAKNTPSLQYYLRCYYARSTEIVTCDFRVELIKGMVFKFIIQICWFIVVSRNVIILINMGTTIRVAKIVMPLATNCRNPDLQRIISILFLFYIKNRVNIDNCAMKYSLQYKQ